MGSKKRKKGKPGESNRVWDDWQRYVKKETQRLKQKSGGNVLQVKFASKKPAKPPEEPPPSDVNGQDYQETNPGRTTAHVEGVPREEALQVSDDYIGRTVKPFTVDDYRGIQPMNRMGGDGADETPTGTTVQEPERAPKKKKAAPVSHGTIETEKNQAAPKKKSKGGRKKAAGDKQKVNELELFGSVSEHQVISRQRLTKKNKLDREELIDKLLDPVISLDQAATLIGVCKTTVRRYTNRGELDCLRTPGLQRRFKLSQVLDFVKKREDEQKNRRNKRPDTSE